MIDAAAAAGYATAVNAPVLLTPPTRLYKPAAHLIERSGITNIYVLGGEAAISAGLLAELEAIPGVQSVIRWGGTNRFDTAPALGLLALLVKHPPSRHLRVVATTKNLGANGNGLRLQPNGCSAHILRVGAVRG